MLFLKSKLAVTCKLTIINVSILLDLDLTVNRSTTICGQLKLDQTFKLVFVNVRF